MELKHTPGPWSVSGQGWVIVDDCGRWIGDARTVNREIEQEHANAALMASAPDLLKLLIESRDNIGGDWRERRDFAILQATGAA